MGTAEAPDEGRPGRPTEKIAGEAAQGELVRRRSHSGAREEATRELTGESGERNSSERDREEKRGGERSRRKKQRGEERRTDAQKGGEEERRLRRRQ